MQKQPYNVKPFIWSSHTITAQMLFYTKPDSILDVGSGKGFLGQTLDYKPKYLCAVDIQDQSLTPAYSVFWKEDLNSTDFSFLANKNFQTIVLADVVEHIIDPVRVVSKLKAHLQKGGVFVFSFPNMGFFPARVLNFLGIRPKMDKGLYDRTHLHDFDLKTSRQFLENLGLKVLEFRAVPVPLPIFSSAFNKGSYLFFVYRILNFMAQKFPNSFAYQLIFRAKIHELQTLTPL